MIGGHKRLSWKREFLVFEGFLLGIAIISLPIFVVIGWGLFLGGWYYTNIFWKIIIYIFASFCIGGQMFLIDRLRDSWYEAKGNQLVIQFYRQPQNKYTYMEIEMPEGSSYTLESLKRFFKFAHYSALFREYTTERRLNYGIGSYDICFDIIVENGKIKCYLAVSLILKETLVHSLKINIPSIIIRDCDNPYKDFPKQWKDDKGSMGYSSMTGTSLGFQLTNSLTSIPESEIDLKSLPIDNLLVSLRDNFPNQRIVLQYVFSFENRHVTSLFAREIKSLRQKIYDRFSLKYAKIKASQEVFHVFLPKLEKTRLNEMEKKLRPNNQFISANIKLLAFCSDQDYIEVEDKLEKLIRSYSGNTAFYRDNNRIEKIFFTSSSQRYFNLEGKNEHPGHNYLYDVFWFPPSWVEPLVSRVYDHFYYYNENRYRRQVMYRRTLRRSGQGPWINKNTLLDFNSIVGVFQIPTIK
jgi:hypothetical protein